MRKLIVVSLAIAALLSTACQSALQDRSNGDPAPQQVQAKAIGNYQDFPDILIPNDMELDDDNSIMVQTPQYKTGFLTYEGRVEAVSLMNFFERNMIKDNWKMRSKFGYKRTIMVFEKPDRDCVINILDGTYNTIVEIMVAPRLTKDDPMDTAGAPPVEENLAQ